MTYERIQRQGRFTDVDPGSGVVQGYRDAVAQDPFNKKFIARNLKQYGTLKKAGLGNKKGLRKLRGMSDTQLERIAAKAVIQKAGIKRRKLPTSYNRRKHNIKWAKNVIARRQAGQSVRKQTLQRTKAARQHVHRINRNRRIMKSPLFKTPKGF